MLRRLRIVKASSESPTVLIAQYPRRAGIPPFVVAVARQYPNRGLNPEQLVAAGEAGWQAAQRHYGADTEGLERWGSRWVRENILRLLAASPGENQPTS